MTRRTELETHIRTMPVRFSKGMESMAQDISELKKLAVAGGALTKVAKVAIPAIVGFAKAPSFFSALALAKEVYPVAAEKLPKVLKVQEVAWPEVVGESLDVSESEAKELVVAFFSA